MAKKLKKLSKKEMKEDKFIEFMAKASTFVQSYSRQLVAGVVICILIIAAAIFMKGKIARSELEAQIDLENVNILYHSGQYIECVEMYLHLIANYGSTRAGKNARCYLGNVYFYLGDIENARRYFEECLKSKPENDYLRIAAKEGIADCLMQSGDYREALDRFEKNALSTEDRDVLARNIYKMGLCQETLGETLLAKETFSRILSEFPESWVAVEAELAMSRFSHDGERASVRGES